MEHIPRQLGVNGANARELASDTGKGGSPDLSRTINDPTTGNPFNGISSEAARKALEAFRATHNEIERLLGATDDQEEAASSPGSHRSMPANIIPDSLAGNALDMLGDDEDPRQEDLGIGLGGLSAREIREGLSIFQELFDVHDKLWPTHGPEAPDDPDIGLFDPGETS